MNRFWNVLRGRVTPDPERLAAQPLISGYRRTVSPVWLILGLIVLAVAFFFYGFYFSAMAPARIMPFTVPIAILGGLVVWALPAGAYAPTRLLEPLFFAFFAALLLWPDYLAIGLPGLPWVTMLRLIVVPLILSLLVCLSASSDFRRRLGEVLNTDKWVWRLLLGYVALLTFSLVVSIDRGLSANRYLVAQTNWTAIFFVSVVVFTRRGFATDWSRALLVMLLVSCAIAVWESRIQQLPWAGHIPTILKIEDESVMRILAGGGRAATGIYRAHAMATTPLGLAEVLGLAAPFAIHMVLERYPIIFRALGAIYIPVAIYAILLTDSRLGMVATLAGMMVYLFFWGLIRWRQNRHSMLGPTIVLTYPIIFLAFMASTFLVGRIRNEVWGDGSQAASDASRREQWAMAIPKVLKRPFGYGHAKGGTALGFTNPAGMTTIDSYYLSLLLEVGIAGFAVYFAMILRAVWTASKTVVGSPQDQETRLLLPITVSLLTFVLVKSVFSQDANHPLIFMMLGAVIALTYRSRRDAARRSESP